MLRDRVHYQHLLQRDLRASHASARARRAHNTTPHARCRTRIRMQSRIPMADDVNIQIRSCSSPPPPSPAPISRLRIRLRFPSVLCASYFEPKIGTIDHHSSRFSESVTHQFL
jgi:hypothetical protein